MQQLISLIEHGNLTKQRVESLQTLKKIYDTYGNVGIEKEVIYNFIENLLISDSDDKIRNEAALMLHQSFKDKALKLMRWTLNHEESSTILSTTYNSLISILTFIKKKNDSFGKIALLQEIDQIKDKDFKIGIDILKSQSDVKECSHSDLTEILTNYYSLIYLKKLHFRLKYTIEDCRVVELNFIFKGLTKLPNAISHLLNLRILSLRYNQITEIPEWISNFHSLETLNLNINNINNLPKTLGSLQNLKELTLWKNELQKLPSSISSLKSLKILNLRLNQLNILPKKFGNLENLEELNLHDNKLTNLPLSFSSLKSLKMLNLSWNLLTTLTEPITELVSLKLLDLERNELFTASPSISSLTSLEILNLCDNKLESIPETIGKLKNLKILNISRNKL
ncbi:MAG: leucine-rich repeat domain-containing protein, partial [Promethearchaeota archaeon]